MDKEEFKEQMDKALPIRDRLPQWAQNLFGFIFIVSCVVGLSYGLTWVNICFGTWCLNGLAFGIALVVWVLVIYWITKVINKYRGKL